MTTDQTQAIETVKAWCMPCKEHVEIANPHEKVISGKRGLRLQVTGKCPTCGGVVNRFLKSKGKIQPKPPEAEERGSMPHPRASRRDPEPPPIKRDHWTGTCGHCRVEREFEGDLVGTRWDGLVVVRGQCLECQMSQVLIGATKIESLGKEQGDAE